MHRCRRGAHERPVTGAPVRIAPKVLERGLVPIELRPEYRTRLRADVLGIVSPELEAAEQIAAVDTAAREDRLGLDDPHLRVVGELAGLPMKATPADHLADPTDNRLRKFL